MRLKDKVVIITGAAQGIGAATATTFVTEGANVIVTDINVAGGEALSKQLGGRARFMRLDVTDEAAWTGLVKEIIASFGRIDGLVNNAAVYFEGFIEDTPTFETRRIIDVDLVGPWLGMKAVVPHMKEARSGSIVNISSVDGV